MLPVVTLGMFKLASFTSQSHSAAEKFLFKECLMKEIEFLNNGYAIDIKGQSYFIQCRLIQFVFDTKEIGHSLCVHCTNAYEICPFCHDTQGLRMPNIKKMIICDQRYLLPLFHGLRKQGQTANCCPNIPPQEYTSTYGDKYKDRFFYSLNFTTTNGKELLSTGKYTNEDFKRENNYSDKEKIAIRKTMFPTPATASALMGPRAATDMGKRLAPFFFNTCDEENRKQIINFLFNEDDTPCIWHHDQKQYPMELFTDSKYLYYEYCNYKPYKPLILKDKAFHQQNANIVNEIREKGKKADHSKGVKDHFYGFDSKYVSLEKHVNFDPAHVIKNIYDYFHQLWTAELPKINEGLFRNFSTNKCWPFIKQSLENRERLPWNISKDNQQKIDAWVLCLHIPMGYKDSFEVNSIFAYTQMSKYNIKMNIIKSLFPLMFFLLRHDMPVEYRALFMMFSEFIIDLSSPVIDTSTINSLYEHSVEYVSLFQGFIPHPEHRMVNHSLIHLPQHIPVAGLLKNWSSYAGERGNSVVKSFIKKGGANFEKTSSKQYNNYEIFMLDSDESPYNFNIDGIIDRSSYIGRTLLDNRELYIDNTKSFVFNPFRMLVYDEQVENGDYYMTHFEATNFLNSLIKEIMKQCSDMNNAKKQSELFRLYCLHLQLTQTYKTTWYKRTSIDSKHETADIWFYDFLSILNSIRLNKMVDNQLDTVKQKFMEEIQNNNNEFILLKSNSSLLKDLFMHMKYKKALSYKALIYGLKCKGRGFNRRIIEHDARNSNNDYTNAMKMAWKDRKEYSMWCKFRFSTRFNNTNRFIEESINYFDGNPDNSYYGQFNFFMKLYIPSEDILHGLKIASVTAIANHTTSYLWQNHSSKKQEYEQYKSRSVIEYIDINKLTILQNALFIPFTDIIATKYGVIGVDNNNNPYLNEKIKLPSQNNAIKQTYFSSDHINNISKLYFIELQPERRDVKFDINNNEMYNS